MNGKGSSASPFDIIPEPDEEVKVQCWCGRSTVGATLADVRRGITKPCKTVRCAKLAQKAGQHVA